MAKTYMHKWTQDELAELFYDALIRDPRSEHYTAEHMDRIANAAARSAWTVKP